MLLLYEHETPHLWQVEKLRFEPSFQFPSKQECLAAVLENALYPGTRLVCAIKILLVLMWKAMLLNIPLLEEQGFWEKLNL